MDTYNPYATESALNDTIEYLQFKPRYFAPDIVKRQAKLVKSILGYKVSWRTVIKLATLTGRNNTSNLVREMDRLYAVNRRMTKWDNPTGAGIYSPDYTRALEIINPDDVLIFFLTSAEKGKEYIMNIVLKNGTRYHYKDRWFSKGESDWAHQAIRPEKICEFIDKLDENNTRIYTNISFFDHTTKGSIA